MHIHATASRDDSQTRPALLKAAEPDQHTAATSSRHGPAIYRKASCPCGGDCPSCQASGLKVSQPNDAAEIEADAIAERVMRMPADVTGVRANERTGGDSIHRKCDACEDEEEKIQRKQLPENSGAALQSPAHVKDVVRSAGRALDVSERSFFEPRLGYDLGAVRLHTDPAANESARAVGARAYTFGRDIVFGSGEFDPHSDHGRYLLAHELAHVTQQDNNSQGEIRRMTLGTGTPPSDWAAYNLRVVPADEVELVNAAIARVQEIVDNPGIYADCIAGFAERCSGQNPTAFSDTFSKAILWRGDDKGKLARGDINGNHMMYTREGYDQGVRGLAQTLIHEMGHNCGVTSGDDHHLAEVSANYCIGPQNYVGVRLGSAFSFATPFTFAFVYRRFFDLALGGQLRLSVGADLDIFGISSALGEAADPTVGAKSEFEIGSPFTTGLHGRFNPWGGEGFGGLTLGLETGLDIGRFRIMRETEPDEYEYGPGVILQSTLGAEFYVPINPSIFQFTPEAGYRLIRPLNPQAENIHELIFGVGAMFF